MLHTFISSLELGEIVLPWIEAAALATEVLAIVIIVLGIVGSTIRYVYLRFGSKSNEDIRYENYRHSLGRSLLLGLEILVAADVVRTVALEATVESVVVLGLLVLIRTFLSWSLTVEIEGYWPWQRKRGTEGER
jgi:uncharacterized membrane protein